MGPYIFWSCILIGSTGLCDEIFETFDLRTFFEFCMETSYIEKPWICCINFKDFFRATGKRERYFKSDFTPTHMLLAVLQNGNGLMMSTLDSDTSSAQTGWSTCMITLLLYYSCPSYGSHSQQSAQPNQVKTSQSQLGLAYSRGVWWYPGFIIN